MNKKFTFNASFRLGDDHLDGVDRGVVDLDVVLLEREVSRDDLLASDGFNSLPAAMSALVTVPLTTWFLQMSPKPSIFTNSILVTPLDLM